MIKDNIGMKTTAKLKAIEIIIGNHYKLYSSRTLEKKEREYNMLDNDWKKVKEQMFIIFNQFHNILGT